MDDRPSEDRTTSTLSNADAELRDRDDDQHGLDPDSAFSTEHVMPDGEEEHTTDVLDHNTSDQMDALDTAQVPVDQVSDDASSLASEDEGKPYNDEGVAASAAIEKKQSGANANVMPPPAFTTARSEHLPESKPLHPSAKSGGKDKTAENARRTGSHPIMDEPAEVDHGEALVGAVLPAVPDPNDAISPLEEFDWRNLEQKYHDKMHELHERERESTLR